MQMHKQIPLHRGTNHKLRSHMFFVAVAHLLKLLGVSPVQMGTPVGSKEFNAYSSVMCFRSNFQGDKATISLFHVPFFLINFTTNCDRLGCRMELFCNNRVLR